MARKNSKVKTGEVTQAQSVIGTGVPGIGVGGAFPLIPGLTGFGFGGTPFGAANGSGFYNGFGSIGVNAYGTPYGTFGNYWLMDRNPTVAISRAAADAPIKSAELTYETKKDVPEEWEEFIREQLQPWEKHILDYFCLARDNGFHCEEVVFCEKDGRLCVDKFKQLSTWATLPVLDDYGNIIAIQNYGKRLDDPRQFIWLAYDVQDGYPYGRSRKENYKKAWLRQEYLYDILEYSMNITVRPVGWVSYPYGVKDASNKDTSEMAKQNAQAIGNGLADGKFVTVPNPYAQFAEQLIKAGVDPDKLMPYKIGFYDTKSDHGEGFARLFGLTDRAIVMGHQLPPRAVLEAQHGSKADSDQAGDVSITVSEQFLNLICRTINTTVIDTLLVQNFGEEAKGCVWWQPSPLIDKRAKLNNELIKTIFSGGANTNLALRVINLANLMEKAGVITTDGFNQEELLEWAQEQEQKAHEIQLAGKQKLEQDDKECEDAEEKEEKESIKASLSAPRTEEERRNRDAILLALLSFYDEQKADFLKAIREKMPIADLRSRHDDRLAAALAFTMIGSAGRGINEAVKEYNLDTAGIAGAGKSAGDVIRSESSRFAKMINDTTYERVNKVIDAVKPEAENATAITEQAIDTTFDSTRMDRLPRIAEDMDFAASQVGRWSIFEELKISYRWYTAEDEHVCEICSPLDNKVVKDGEEFAPGIRFPVLHTHPGCRCRIIPIVNGNNN